ncbi:MAG: hypothetical protein Q6K18_07115 [Gloeomargarita sp. DG_1_5_bins_55]
MGYLSFRNGQQSVEVVAQELQTEIAQRVQTELDDFWGFAPKLVAILRSMTKASGRYR